MELDVTSLVAVALAVAGCAMVAFSLWRLGSHPNLTRGGRGRPLTDSVAVPGDVRLANSFVFEPVMEEAEIENDPIVAPVLKMAPIRLNAEEPTLEITRRFRRLAPG